MFLRSFMEINCVDKVSISLSNTYVQHYLLHPVNMRFSLNFHIFLLNNIHIIHSLETCHGNATYKVSIFTVMLPCSCTGTMIKILNQNWHMYELVLLYDCLNFICIEEGFCIKIALTDLTQG